MSTRARSCCTSSSRPAASGATVAFRPSGGRRRCSRSCASPTPRARARPAGRTTRAAAAAWPRSSSPVCRSTAPTRSASTVMARRRCSPRPAWGRPRAAARVTPAAARCRSPSVAGRPDERVDDMAGRVAIVTGAARGIGAATVRRLVADGWSVVAVDACADDPALSYPMATKADLDALTALGAVTTAVADVRSCEALASAVELAESTYGGLDAALAVAGGVGGRAPHWGTRTDSEQAVLDVDLGGVLNLARVAVPALLRRPAPRSGRFVAVASAVATRGLPNLAAYCAAKAGVTGFVRALAVELGGSGVTANAVSPGSTATPALDGSAALYQLEGTAEFVDQQPIGRLLSPEEIATAIAWIVGAENSAMTGAVVAVDGG